MQVAPKHDFTSKLRQESLLPRVMNYIDWQRSVHKATAAGLPIPSMPPLSLISINLDLTTACNYRCTHCIDWNILNTGIQHDYAVLEASLENLIENGLKSVILIGGGEPTLHRHFADVVRFLKGRQIKVGIVTNGSRGEVLEEVAPSLTKGDWIRLSLDSGRNETFVRMHLPLNKAVNLESICAWIPKVRRTNPLVQVGFSFIITWQGAHGGQETSIIPNIGEIVGAAKLARDHEFTYISYKPFLTWFGDGAEVIDVAAMQDNEETLALIRRAVDEAKTLETDDFKVLESTNLRVLMEGNWRDFTRQPKTCHIMAFREVLSPLGVFHCPAKRGDEHARVGGSNALAADHDGQTREAVAKMLNSFDASVECKEITCLYNETNWWLEKLVTGESDMVELTALADRGDYYL